MFSRKLQSSYTQILHKHIVPVLIQTIHIVMIHKGTLNGIIIAGKSLNYRSQITFVDLQSEFEPRGRRMGADI